jgi:hypothetical protein
MFHMHDLLMAASGAAGVLGCQAFVKGERTESIVFLCVMIACAVAA